MSADITPAFVGIGALKAGTTYLDVVLREHPDLALPTYIKETDYFSANFDRGYDWYLGLFPDRPGMRGEFSPTYITSAQAPSRIADVNAAARIVVSLRDPVRRLQSQYRHWVQESGYRGTIDRFVTEHPNAVQASRYYDCLQPWLAAFPRAQLHVIVFEELTADPQPALDALYAFLGVVSHPVPESVREPVNATALPRFPRGYRFAKRVGAALQRHGGAAAVDRAKRAGVARAVKGTRAVPATAGGPMPAGVRAALREDATRLSGLLEVDLLSCWPETAATRP